MMVGERTAPHLAEAGNREWRATRLQARCGLGHLVDLVTWPDDLG